MTPFEPLDHPADIGLAIRADSVRTLFIEAARGLYALMGEDWTKYKSFQPPIQQVIKLAADGYESLMVDWLSELIYFMDTQQLIFTEQLIEVTQGAIHAVVRGGKLPPESTASLRAIKAVTYHDLKVEKEVSGWSARVFFDI